MGDAGPGHLAAVHRCEFARESFALSSGRVVDDPLACAALLGCGLVVDCRSHSGPSITEVSRRAKAGFAPVQNLASDVSA